MRPGAGAVTFLRLIAEAGRVARSQPAASAVTALVVGAVCAVILSTTGQTVQAERQVLARIDQAGTRSIVVTDPQGGGGLTAPAVDRIERLSSVEWVIGLGAAFDVRAMAVAAGEPVAVREFHGDLPPLIDATPWSRGPDTLLVGAHAQRVLGLRIPAGGVSSARGDLAVVGAFTAGEPLAFLDRSALVAGDPDDISAPVRSIHVLAKRPEDVESLAVAIRAVLGAADPSQLAVETSAELAAVRAAVRGELGTFGRNLVLMVLGAGLVLVALTMYAAVTARRRDFGRRRALGATRGAITALVTAQAAITGTVGAIVGVGVGAGIVWRLTGSLPSVDFAVAVGMLAVLAALVAALPPAVVASYRDPLRVLRVP
jgi:putative ABC transport system permease protein